MKNNFLNSEETTKKYVESIRTTEIKKKDVLKRISISHNFIDGPFVNIDGSYDDKFSVRFYDETTGELIHNSEIGSNMWTKANRKYFTNWRIEVKDSKGIILFNKSIDLKDKRVYIAIDSSSIGDNIAWVPYLEEFRKKHDCKLIVSTFWNQLFEESYPNLEFTNPGDEVSDLYAMYKVGCFFNYDLEPEQSNILPLQKVPCNILGLEYKEIKPEIKFNPHRRPYKKYVAIAPHSTAGLKYWNNETGWQEVVDYLKSNGYEVVNVSKEGCDLNGVTSFDNYSMDMIMNSIYHSEFFIGLSSGLSWLAWAMDKHVFLISNFTNKEHEFSSNCTRIVNESVCNSCWVDKSFTFDKGDWNWCPRHKGTERQFECSKSITGQYVIDKIKEKEKENFKKDFDWGDSNAQLISELKKEIFEDTIYERVFEVNEGDVVVDVGASVGPFTYSILDKKPKKVFCLEPSILQYKTLLKNFEGHPVVCINKGITDVDGPFKSEYVFGGDSIDSFSGISFKSFIENNSIDKIDFLKLDCEGGEYDVLNLENLEAVKSVVKNISAEFHLRTPELKIKFKEFITNVLPTLGKYHVYSVDGYDITDRLYGDEFIPRFNEIMMYIAVE